VQCLGIQLDIVWENKPANFAKVRDLLRAAAPAPGSLIVLPEMFATGFSMNTAALCEPQGGETEKFLCELAASTSSLVMAGLPALDSSGRARNEAWVFGPTGEALVRYAKIHPFTLGGESLRYEAGGEVMTFKHAGWTIAPFICYDLRFPELFRAAVARGAELLVVIANWPVKRIQHWVTLLQARAIENQAWVVGVNRCGTDPDFVYTGRTLVVDPHGIVIADANDREGVLSVALDRAVAVEWRRQFPALLDMASRPPTADTSEGPRRSDSDVR